MNNAGVVQTEEQPLFQMEDGGAVPTSSLKECKVSLASFNAIRGFVAKHHYGGDPNGIIPTVCFKLTYRDKLLGVAIFGELAMAGVWKKYVDSPKKIIELRRLCCIDDTPKNTESYFISKCLIMLKKYGKWEKVISYADPEYGHKGTIYKASNFEMVGKSPIGKVIYYKGRKYHDKVIRTKYKGRLKNFAQEIKDALITGEAEYKTTQGKYIFLKGGVIK